MILQVPSAVVNVVKHCDELDGLIKQVAVAPEFCSPVPEASPVEPVIVVNEVLPLGKRLTD